MTDPAAVPPQPQPTPSASQSGTGGFLDIKRNFKHLVVVLAIVGALVVGWIVFRQVGSAATGKPGPPLFGGSQVLVNQTVEVTDDGWKIFTFRLDRMATVELEFDVIKGDKATAHIIDDAERERFAQASTSIGGQFRHYPALEGKDKQQHRAYGNLPAGAYALVISESSNPNILGSPDKATVRVKVNTR